MCGIAGFISQRLKSDHLSLMCNNISHRGPDSAGYFQEGKTFLGHRRLSIIDLSDVANQPLYSQDGQWVIIFNGEIYNYAEIRKNLISKGYVFNTHSDTEVVLNAFIDKGPAAVQDFIGMFAFAIYNRNNKKLFLFRDRVGVKPFYYYHAEGEVIFASELKSISPYLPSKNIDPIALQDFFRYGYISGERTIFKEVRTIPPGHYVEVDEKGSLKVTPYWRIEEKICRRNFSSINEAAGELESLMVSAFNYRMVADVPVGVFLSGGIDSSSLTAILARDNNNLKTFSIGFDDARYNEAPYASAIARHFGTDHHEKILTAKDAEDVMDQYFEIYDEPFADSSGIPVYLISHFAREAGCKVVLSADGGDELFGGYDRYMQVPALFNRFNGRRSLLKPAATVLEMVGALGGKYKNLQHRTSKLKGLVEESGDAFNTAFYENYLSISSPAFLKKLLDKHVDSGNSVIPGKLLPAEEMMLWDFKNYLPSDLLVKVDRASMATSIEAREPFLDHRLVEFAFSLPLEYKLSGSSQKHILKQVLYKYIPAEMFDRPKMGFSIPLFRWFSQRLDQEFENLFQKELLDQIHCLDTKTVLAEFNKYKYFKKIGKEYNILMIWHLYVFIKWWKRWMN